MLLLLLACAAPPDGLRLTPAGDGPMVRVDFDAEPLADIPYPNNMATRTDLTSATGRRLNVETHTETEVEEESARRGDPGPMGAAAPSAARDARPPSPDDAGGEESASARNWGDGERAAPSLELPEVEDGVGLPSDPDDDTGVSDGATGGDSLGDLLPDFEGERVAAATGGGGAGSFDYLKDVKDGERTLLNRRRVNYSDFYARVKLGVVNHWSPIRVYRRRDPTGRIYGTQDRVTVLNVTLKGDGTLHTLYVERESGLDFLDAEAVRAMNAAVPFPNPPEGLKDIDGMVTFRFAFHVDVSTRKFRLFRYR